MAGMAKEQAVGIVQPCPVKGRALELLTLADRKSPFFRNCSARSTWEERPATSRSLYRNTRIGDAYHKRRPQGNRIGKTVGRLLIFGEKRQECLAGGKSTG